MVHNLGFLALVDDAKSRIAQIDIVEYQRMLAQGVPHLLIDVREESEWSAGRAVGATHIGKGVIERDIERLAPDRSATLVLYCGGGYRSALAADNLRRMGYTNVMSLDGGWRAYTDAGLAVQGQ